MDTYQRRMVDATPAADLWVPSWLLWSNDTSAECWSWIFWKHHFGVPSIEDTGTNLDTYFHIFLSIKRHGLRDILYNDIIIWYVTCIYTYLYSLYFSFTNGFGVPTQVDPYNKHPVFDGVPGKVEEVPIFARKSWRSRWADGLTGRMLGRVGWYAVPPLFCSYLKVSEMVDMRTKPPKYHF